MNSAASTRFQVPSEVRNLIHPDEASQIGDAKRACIHVPAREEISMTDHLTISTESDLTSPALPPTTTVTRRSLLGGAGIAVGAAVLASPPGMPGIAPAAAQPVSADPRPLDAAFKRRASAA